MKTIVVLGLVASLLSAAPTFAGTAGTDGLCGPNGPEAYNRPGGYCEILGANRSLSGPGGGNAAADGPEGGEVSDVVVVSGCELPADGGLALC